MNARELPTTGDALLWGEVAGRAELSQCQRYRYSLERRWDNAPRYVLWVMLNPSIADAVLDDATIRRCMGYARAWGYGGILVGNLYAWRATDPRELDRAANAGLDVIGPENGRHLSTLIARASLVMCAWGRSGPLNQAKFEVMQRLRPPVVPHYLKLNANAEPAHPLRLPKSLKPTPWDYFTRPTSPGVGG